MKRTIIRALHFCGIIYRPWNLPQRMREMIQAPIERKWDAELRQKVAKA